MKLTYETAVATLIQFIAVSFLNFANGIDAIVMGCRAHDGDCVSNTIVTFIYIILIVGWFAFLWVLGWAAQDRRSKWLARFLICAEALVVLISYFNAKHHPNILNLVTSVIDLGLALWVIMLAFRLMRAKGGRVVSHARTRTRKRPPTSL